MKIVEVTFDDLKVGDVVHAVRNPVYPHVDYLYEGVPAIIQDIRVNSDGSNHLFARMLDTTGRWANIHRENEPIISVARY